MNSILRITDPILKDDSIDKYEEIAYEEIAGTNLNAPGQDIRLTIETQDIKLKGIWINESNKPFPQLWLE